MCGSLSIVFYDESMSFCSMSVISFCVFGWASPEKWLKIVDRSVFDVSLAVVSLFLVVCV